MVGSSACRPTSAPGHPDLGQPGAVDALAGDERRAAGRAALLAVGVGEPHPLVGDAVDVRRAVAHQPVAVAAQVRDADVVAPDDQDVGLVVGHAAVSSLGSSALHAGCSGDEPASPWAGDCHPGTCDVNRQRPAEQASCASTIRPRRALSSASLASTRSSTASSRQRSDSQVAPPASCAASASTISFSESPIAWNSRVSRMRSTVAGP